MRVGGSFACDIPGFELGDSGIEVFDVERDDARDPVLGVDLDDVKGIVLNRVGIAAGGANTCEDETLPRGSP